MIDLLVATVAFSVVVLLLLVAAVLLVVAPLYAALQMADSRGFSTARWTVVSSLAVLAGLATAYVLHQRGGIPEPVSLLPLPLTWAGPALLWVLDPAQQRIGGRAGLHE